MALNQENFTLWQLASQVSPCRWRAYNRWHDITSDRLSDAAERSIEMSIQKRFPRKQHWELIPELNIAMEHKAKKLQSDADHILYSYLPEKVLKALKSDNYTIRAKKNGEGSFVNISNLDMTGLNIILHKNMLEGRTVFYTEVSINNIRKGRGRKPGDGKYNDIYYLKEMKRIIENGEVNSVHAAAQKFSKEAKGASEEAVIQRLEKGYKKLQDSGFL